MFKKLMIGALLGSLLLTGTLVLADNPNPPDDLKNSGSPVFCRVNHKMQQ